MAGRGGGGDGRDMQHQNNVLVELVAGARVEETWQERNAVGRAGVVGHAQAAKDDGLTRLHADRGLQVAAGQGGAGVDAVAGRDEARNLLVKVHRHIVSEDRGRQRENDAALLVSHGLDGRPAVLREGDGAERRHGIAHVEAAGGAGIDAQNGRADGAEMAVTVEALNDCIEGAGLDLGVVACGVGLPAKADPELAAQEVEGKLKAVARGVGRIDLVDDCAGDDLRRWGIDFGEQEAELLNLFIRARKDEQIGGLVEQR